MSEPISDQPERVNQPESVVDVAGLQKSFGDNHVLRGIDFTVDRGTVTVILGPSGSGKTTILRSLNALDIPDAGVIRVGEQTIDFGGTYSKSDLSLIHISEPTRQCCTSRMPSSA